MPSITGSPVFACEINDLAKDGKAYRAIQGRGCHPLPEIALFKALAEAIQGRATYIAGARDDLMPSDYVANDSAIQIAFGFPLPPDMDGVDFAEIASGPSGAAELATALGVAGYDQIAIIDLAQPTGLSVVRAFVCGLGSLVLGMHEASMQMGSDDQAVADRAMKKYGNLTDRFTEAG